MKLSGSGLGDQSARHRGSAGASSAGLLREISCLKESLAKHMHLSAVQSNARRSSLGPRGMPRHLLGPSVAGSVGQLDAVAAS